MVPVLSDTDIEAQKADRHVEVVLEDSTTLCKSQPRLAARTLLLELKTDDVEEEGE